MLSFLYRYSKHGNSSVSNQSQQQQQQHQQQQQQRPQRKSQIDRVAMASGGESFDMSSLTRKRTAASLGHKVNWGEVTLRRRLVADCQIIVCILLSGAVLVLLGAAMFLTAKLLSIEDSPLLLIGPVVIGCGLAVLLLSVETCVKRSRLAKQTDDLSSDDEDGNTVDEGLVNYGYGNYQPRLSRQKAPSVVTAIEGSTSAAIEGKTFAAAVAAATGGENYVPSFK